jgi:transposase
MRDGMFFLIATIDIPEPEPFEPEGFLGVDLGIVNIATTSDGEIMAGRRLNRYRKRHRDLRTRLRRNAPSPRSGRSSASAAVRRGMPPTPTTSSPRSLSPPLNAPRAGSPWET